MFAVWVVVVLACWFSVAFCVICYLVVLCCIGCVFWFGGFAVWAVLVCVRFACVWVFSVDDLWVLLVCLGGLVTFPCFLGFGGLLAVFVCCRCGRFWLVWLGYFGFLVSFAYLICLCCTLVRLVLVAWIRCFLRCMGALFGFWCGIGCEFIVVGAGWDCAWSLVWVWRFVMLLCFLVIVDVNSVV